MRWTGWEVVQVLQVVQVVEVVGVRGSVDDPDPEGDGGRSIVNYKQKMSGTKRRQGGYQGGGPTAYLHKFVPTYRASRMLPTCLWQGG